MDALELFTNLEGMNIHAIAMDALKMNTDVMADLNAEQMAQGIRATGSEIKPAYHPLTVEIKRTEKTGLAAVTDHVTLYDTGSHYRQLYAEVKGDEIEYGSRDSKSEKLENKYGRTIYGLTEDSREELVQGSLQGDFCELAHIELGL
jgi:hypothetical protein